MEYDFVLPSKTDQKFFGSGWSSTYFGLGAAARFHWYWWDDEQDFDTFFKGGIGYSSLSYCTNYSWRGDLCGKSSGIGIIWGWGFRYVMDRDLSIVFESSTRQYAYYQSIGAEFRF